MQAVILAAGQGTRLGTLTQQQPKALLPIGGQPLIRWSLDCLARAGANDVLLITGYRGQMIRDALGESHRGMTLRFVENPDFATSGSMLSLLAAAPALADAPFLLLESDLLYHPEFLARACAGPGDALLAADLSGSGDEVYLCADSGGQVSFLGKNAPAARRAEAVGEFAGISRLSPALFQAYCEATRALATKGDRDRHYEEVLFDLAQAGRPLRVLACPGLPWTEIDNAGDLDRALTRVWPALDFTG